MVEKAGLLNALIIGSTGAVGRELVTELCASNKWSKIHLIVRRELQQWEALPNKDKINIIKVESLDELQDSKKWKFENVNSFFCCLGGRTKEGNEQFTKTDYTYPLYGAQIAKDNGISQYSIVSSQGADSTSMFLYMKTKGKIENEIKQLKFPICSIFRPGLIANRDNDSRFVEKICKYIPFLPQIESKQLARAIRIEAEIQHEKQSQNLEQTYENKQILNLLKQNL